MCVILLYKSRSDTWVAEAGRLCSPQARPQRDKGPQAPASARLLTARLPGAADELAAGVRAGAAWRSGAERCCGAPGCAAQRGAAGRLGCWLRWRRARAGRGPAPEGAVPRPWMTTGCARAPGRLRRTPSYCARSARRAGPAQRAQAACCPGRYGAAGALRQRAVAPCFGSAAAAADFRSPACPPV